MKYLLFKNAGEIEINAFKLLGASTKRNNSDKIGFFGSGLKYAIAYLLRNNLRFAVFCGEKQLEVATRKADLRDSSFDQVYIDGEPTSITTDWGINWKAWQIFRELACNAYDEGGEILLADSSEIEGKAQETRFYVEALPFEKYYQNMSEYIYTDLLCQSKPCVIEKTRLSPMIIYQKGIRVVPEERGVEHISLFDYQVYGHTNLSEDRLISDERNSVRQILRGLENQKQIIRLLEESKIVGSPLLELDLFNSWYWGELSPAYAETIKKLKWTIAPIKLQDPITRKFGHQKLAKHHTVFIQDGFYNVIAQSFPSAEFLFSVRFSDGQDSEEAFISPTEQKILDFAIEKVSKAIPSFLDYRIKVVNFSNPEIFGEADMDFKIIKVSPKAIEKGNRFLVATLLEEYIHLHYKCGDYTRNFQDNSLELFATFLLSN